MKTRSLVLWTFLALLAAGGIYLGFKATGHHEAGTKAQDDTSLPDHSLPLPVTVRESEPPPAKAAYCPVPKPESAPEGLANTLVFISNSSLSPQRLSLSSQMEELKALAQKPPRKDAAEALRWLVHQAGQAEVLRHEALIVLGAWGENVAWLSGDLERMLKDPAQSAVWRAYCVQHLGSHYQRHRDEPSYRAMDSAASADDPAVRDQSTYSLALLAKELSFQDREPEHFAAFRRHVLDALSSNRSSTVVSGLRSAAVAGLKDLSARAEGLAKDEKQQLEVRVAAVQALGAIGRAESIPVLETCASSKEKTLARFAQVSLKALRPIPPK